eukprot:1169524_1
MWYLYCGPHHVVQCPMFPHVMFCILLFDQCTCDDFHVSPKPYYCVVCLFVAFTLSFLFYCIPSECDWSPIQFNQFYHFVISSLFVTFVSSLTPSNQRIQVFPFRSNLIRHIQTQYTLSKSSKMTT